MKSLILAAAATVALATPAWASHNPDHPKGPPPRPPHDQGPPPGKGGHRGDHQPPQWFNQAPCGGCLVVFPPH